MSEWGPLLDRRYVEAYPRLEIRRAQKGFQNGYDSVIWRDHDGEPVGLGSVSFCNDTRIEVSVEIYGSKHLSEFKDRMRIPLRCLPAGNLRTEGYAICRGCMKPVKYFIYKRSVWVCRQCQGLLNRSSMVSVRIRKTERLVKLEKVIGCARKPGMHQSKYDRLCAEHDCLLNELNGIRYTANENYLEVITAEWTRSNVPKYSKPWGA